MAAEKVNEVEWVKNMVTKKMKNSCDSWFDA